MKQIILSLLFVLLPMNLLAGDICTNGPDNYMVDKRCYVTDAQKKTKPYNAVVTVLRDGAAQGGNCTGTIVKSGNKFYLYTAKHCTDLNNDNSSDSSLNIKLQNGQEVKAWLNNSGNADLQKKSNLSGDWAVYSLDVSGLSSVGKASIKNGGSIRIIGFGRLKIMSDAEIKDFKQKYVAYLKSEGITKSFDKYGVSGKVIDTNNAKVSEFISQLDSGYKNKIFNDTALKESRCNYSNGMRYCQGWHGSSGGGIFDKNGDMVGIVSYGENYIGGIDSHAKLNSEVVW